MTIKIIVLGLPPLPMDIDDEIEKFIISRFTKVSKSLSFFIMVVSWGYILRSVYPILKGIYYDGKTITADMVETLTLDGWIFLASTCTAILLVLPYRIYLHRTKYYKDSGHIEDNPSRDYYLQVLSKAEGIYLDKIKRLKESNEVIKKYIRKVAEDRDYLTHLELKELEYFNYIATDRKFKSVEEEEDKLRRDIFSLES